MKLIIPKKSRSNRNLELDEIICSQILWIIINSTKSNPVSACWGPIPRKCLFSIKIHRMPISWVVTVPWEIGSNQIYDNLKITNFQAIWSNRQICRITDPNLIVCKTQEPVGEIWITLHFKVLIKTKSISPQDPYKQLYHHNPWHQWTWTKQHSKHKTTSQSLNTSMMLD